MIRVSKISFITSTNNPYLLILISFVVNLILVLQVENSLATELSLPKIKIKEFVWNSTEVIQVFEKSPNSVLIAGEDLGNGTRIQLECSADYPIQWIFRGDGMPEFSSNTTAIWETGKTENETEVPKEFFAVINIGLKQLPTEYDTGNYSCTSIQTPHISSYYYLFVPGSQLFTSQGGKNITYNARKTKNLRIPCTTTHPNVTVTLQKSYNGLVTCPINESISFDPKTGFNLKVTDLSHLEGDYVCTGSWNRTLFRIIEFTVVQSSIPNDVSEDENEIYITTTPKYINITPRPTLYPTYSTTTERTTTYINHHNNNNFHHTSTSLSSNYFTPTSSRPRPNEPIYESPCSRSPCGLYARCEVSYRGNPMCRCIENYKGNPYVECYPKQPNNYPNSELNFGTMPEGYCQKNRECDESSSCIKGLCVEVCKMGICGRNSNCDVINHIPNCNCPKNMIGDPYRECRNISEVITPGPAPPTTNSNPCDEPEQICGSYSTCKLKNEVISCECLPRASGSPPNCRPECTEDHHCPLSRGCIDNLCQNPCDQSPCGPNSFCQVVSQKRVCKCRPGFLGDPNDLTKGCLQAKKATLDPFYRSCSIFNQNPCGTNAMCLVNQNGGKVKCECLNGLKGDPYKECLDSGDDPSVGDVCQDHYDCPAELACFTDKKLCVDPCSVTKCAPRMICEVMHHRPVCRNRTHDDIQDLKFNQVEAKVDDVKDVCKPFPCGNNSQCSVLNETAVCTCILGHSGNASDLITGCTRTNCSLDTDCPATESCIKDFCDDPCYFYDCGVFAEKCNVVDHRPVCQCPPNSKGFFGNICSHPNTDRPDDPLQINDDGGNLLDLEKPEDLQNFIQKVDEPEVDPCNPSPCHGKNAVCKKLGKMKWECVCPEFSRGDPNISCEFEECDKSSDCPPSLYCNPFNKSCTNPCKIKGICGKGANCTVNKNIPSCFCPPETTGDPFELCNPIKVMKTEDMIMNEIDPINCTKDSDCALDKSCVFNAGRNRERSCSDPCQFRICGKQSSCRVKKHISECYCNDGFSGDPLNECFLIPQIKEGAPLHKMICDTNSTANVCGLNALCQNANTERSFCKCKEGYVGNPYVVCREALSCLYNSDCSSNRHCVNEKCLDPCSKVGACGVNQYCKVETHKSVCHCKPGYMWKLGNCFPSDSIDSLKAYMNLPKSEYYYPEDVYSSPKNLTITTTTTTLPPVPVPTTTTTTTYPIYTGYVYTTAINSRKRNHLRYF